MPHAIATLRFRILGPAMIGLIWGISGCATSTGPEVLAVPAHEYASTFDAAVEAARQNGLSAVLRDRRAGVIETDARTSGSVLEPWRLDNASLGQSVENTLGLQRRRARFEFTPAGFNPETPRIPLAANAEAPPDTLGDDPLTADAIDLSSETQELELRVWVYIERASSPGVRRGTWTRHSTTTSRSDRAATTSVEHDAVSSKRNKDDERGGTVWTTVARDTAYERRLMAAVETILTGCE